MISFARQDLVVGSADLTARERPPHRVSLGPFALADRCVSAGDFTAFLHDAPDDMDHLMIDCIDPGFVVHRADGFQVRPGCADFPMIQISFWGAAAYCNWLSRGEGFQPVYDLARREAGLSADGYRLPREAEWEAACRQGHPAGTAGTGNTADAPAACRALRAGEAGLGAFRRGEPGPIPTAARAPDAAGLHEMIGNVREWCHDRYAPYSAEPARDPSGPGRGSFRVVRGGSFADPGPACRPASRMAAFEDTKCEVYGFRVARSL